MNVPRRVRTLVLAVAGAFGLAAAGVAAAPESPRRSPLSDAITEIDLDRARRLLDAASGEATVLALERARLAIYLGQCDAAAAELSVPTLSESPAGASLSALAGSCARATAAGFVIEDREKGIWLRLQDDADRALAPFIVETAATARDVVGAELGIDFPRPLRIDLVRDLFSLSAVSGLPLEAAETTGTLAVARWGRVIMLSPRATDLGFPWQDTLAHEITHLLVTRATTDHAPLWLQEGVAKREESRWRAARPFDDPSWAEQTARSALLAGRSVGLDRLGPSIAMLPSPELASTAYAEVASFLTYFLAESGAPALRLLFADIKGTASDSADPALRSVSGYDLSAWGRRWQAALREVPARDPREERERTDTMRDPRALARRVRLGDLLVERGHPRAALAEFRAALELAPTHAGVRFRAARAALAIRDRPAAEATLGTLRDVRAPHGAWMALRGRFDREAGRLAEANLGLEHALGLDPLSSDVACEGRLFAADLEKVASSVAADELPSDPNRRTLCEAVRAGVRTRPR
jgi:tetratricopeptide (TPR) repeat protein